VLVTSRDCVPIAAAGKDRGVTTSCSSSQANMMSTSFGSSPEQCSFSTSCTSWVYNRSAYNQEGGDSSPYHVSLPSFADTQERVALVLDGQPLVVAGGAIMRMSKDTSNGQHLVDFPMLVGNQYNEFTMEVASPAGIPVMPLAQVPSMSQIEELPGFISVPPNNIEITDLYNPATLSTDAMW